MSGQKSERFLSLEEAAALRGGKSDDPKQALRLWLWRWNKEHPFGDDLYIHRQPGLVHEESFRRALEALKERKEHPAPAER